MKLNRNDHNDRESALYDVLVVVAFGTLAYLASVIVCAW
jgi:hypothetical protein